MNKFSLRSLIFASLIFSLTIAGTINNVLNPDDKSADFWFFCFFMGTHIITFWFVHYQGLNGLFFGIITNWVLFATWSFVQLNYTTSQEHTKYVMFFAIWMVFGWAYSIAVTGGLLLMDICCRKSYQFVKLRIRRKSHSQ